MPLTLQEQIDWLQSMMTHQPGSLMTIPLRTTAFDIIENLINDRIKLMGKVKELEDERCNFLLQYGTG